MSSSSARACELGSFIVAYYGDAGAQLIYIEAIDDSAQHSVYSDETLSVQARTRPLLLPGQRLPELS